MWVHGDNSPQADAIRIGEARGDTLFIKHESAKGHRFASFPDLQTLKASIGTENHNLYEVIRRGQPVKLYVDVDYYVDEHPELSLDVIVEQLKAKISEVLHVSVKNEDFMITDASGIVEHSTAPRLKGSYHILDNAMHFPNNQDAKHFMQSLQDLSHFDQNPYGSTQCIRRIYCSKRGSTRRLMPLDEGQHDHERHMVTTLPPNSQPYDLSGISSLDASGGNVMSESSLVADVEVPHNRVRSAVTDGEGFDDVPTLLEYLPNRNQPFNVYFAVACICKNTGQPFEVLNEWASQYHRHDEEQVRGLWDSLRRREGGYTIRTLQALVRKVFPHIKSLFTQKYIQQCMYPTINLADHNIDYKSYVSERMLPWMDEFSACKHLMIRSAMGSGKTFQIIATILRYQPKSIVVITPRKDFAKTVLGVLRAVAPELVLYKQINKTDRHKHNFMVCQLESLHTLKHADYDLVIIDESESVFSQFGSSTMRKYFDHNSRAFEDIVKTAKHCIWADAY